MPDITIRVFATGIGGFTVEIDALKGVDALKYLIWKRREPQFQDLKARNEADLVFWKVRRFMKSPFARHLQ